MKLELLYLAWNRRRMAETSFRLLHTNTDWRLVDRLVIYDDGSTDGTDEWLREAGTRVPVPAFDFRQVELRSPPATMNDAFACTDADVIAKIDSDIAVCPGWLERMLDVMQRHPWLDCLGMEAARTGPYEGILPRGSYAYEAGSHIGGVGLIRTRAIRKPIMARGRFGWTEFQTRWDLERGWIVPDLPVVQLDLIPEEPWVSLAAEYVAQEWSRPWPSYDPMRPEWWQWIGERGKVAA